MPVHAARLRGSMQRFRAYSMFAARPAFGVFGLLLLACHGGVRATCVTCPAEIAPAPSAPERLDLTSVPISMDFSKYTEWMRSLDGREISAIGCAEDML